MFNKDPEIPNHRLSRVRSQCFYRNSVDLDRGVRFRVHLVLFAWVKRKSQVKITWLVTRIIGL